MNDNSIKWISLYGMNLNAHNLSLPQRLDRFGYGIVLDEFGTDKATKAQICIFDELEGREKPNILVICPPQLVHSWYKSLLVELGVDFKFVTGSSDTSLFFSEEISNLYIMSDEVLRENGGETLKALNSSGIVWDLMIIDAALAVDGVKADLYTQNAFIKANKLIIFAPFPSAYNEKPDGIKKIVKSLLADREKAAEIDNFPVDATVLDFSLDTPFMKYYDDSSFDNNAKVTVIPYKIEKKYIPSNKRINDISTGVPHYVYGGNIFEEYSIDERKLYLRNVYSAENLKKLRVIDTKLDAFLKKTDDILKDSGNTIIVYFDSYNTVDYIYKALCSVYSDNTDMIKVQKGDLFDIQWVMQSFEAGKNRRRPRIILATDYLNEKCSVVEKITHIINYELPANPAVLQQRYKRRGFVKSDNPEFILFKDENGRFDSRILGKALAGNVYKAYRQDIPTKNIMMYIPQIDEMLADMLIELKRVAGRSTEVGGAGIDLIAKFAADYNVPAELKLAPGAKAHEYTTRKLEAIKKAFGVDALINSIETDKKELVQAISAKTEQLRNGFAFYDEKMTLQVIPDANHKTAEYDTFNSQIAENKYVNGIAEAKKLLDEKLDGADDYPQIREETNGMTDSLLTSVLYNVWKYCTEQKKIYKTYSEFIRKYNEGAI